MKTARKVLLLLLCAALLVSASVMGTMAYLTDNESAVNTFTVGKVYIDLNETDVDGDENTKANAYHLLPGQSYVKDPKVTVEAESEDCYVRMLVTPSDLDGLKAAFPELVAEDGTFLLQGLVSGWDETVWEYEGCVNGVYEFRYNAKVLKNTEDQVLPALFTNVVVPGTATNEDLAEIDNIKIDIVAHAIQAAGFETVDAAWAAFDAQN